jgi:hypothetical protein
VTEPDTIAAPLKEQAGLNCFNALSQFASNPDAFAGSTAGGASQKSGAVRSQQHRKDRGIAKQGARGATRRTNQD